MRVSLYWIHSGSIMDPNGMRGIGLQWEDVETSLVDIKTIFSGSVVHIVSATLKWQR